MIDYDTFQSEKPLISGRTLVNESNLYIGNSSNSPIQIARTSDLNNIDAVSLNGKSYNDIVSMISGGCKIATSYAPGGISPGFTLTTNFYPMICLINPYGGNYPSHRSSLIFIRPGTIATYIQSNAAGTYEIEVTWKDSSVVVNTMISCEGDKNIYIAALGT